MNNTELLRYVLMKKEREMGQTLDEEQERLYNKIEKVCSIDSNIKNEINLLLNSDSLRNTYDILDGKVSVQPQTEKTNDVIINKVENIENIVTNKDSDDGDRQLVKKAGFVDALVMALVTGFVGGVATTILFILI